MAHSSVGGRAARLALSVGRGACRGSYALSGGAAFLSAEGPVLADLRGTVLGVPFRQVRAGVASGATSWNIPAGQLNLSFDDDGVSPSLDSSSSELYMQRRAGAIFIDFPLIQLRSLDPIGIDLTLASRESPMHSPLIAESAVDVAGAAGLLIFEEVAGLVLGVARPEQTVLPLPLSVLVSVAAVESPGEVNAVHLKA